MEEYNVTKEFEVYWGDMDAFNHVNNTVYFKYFEHIRIVYLAESRFMESYQETGVGPILKTASCKFKFPLTYPDKILVGTKVTDISEDRFTMKFGIFSQTHKILAAEGEGIIVSYDFTNAKKAAIPKIVRDFILKNDPGAEIR